MYWHGLIKKGRYRGIYGLMGRYQKTEHIHVQKIMMRKDPIIHVVKGVGLLDSTRPCLKWSYIPTVYIDQYWKLFSKGGKF